MGTGVGEAAAAGSAKGAGTAAAAGTTTAAAGTAAAAGTGVALGTGITAAGTAAGAGAMGAGALGTGITAGAASAGAMGAGALGTGLTAGAVGLGTASALGGGSAGAMGAGALGGGLSVTPEMAAGFGNTAGQTSLWQDIYSVGSQLVDNPLGKYIVQQGVTSAIGARAESKQQQALQDQLSRIASINNTSYGASQASPVGLIGSGGKALDPAATAAGMSRSAPILPGVAATQGTQAAPTTPRAQIGAVKLGVRPRQYGG